MDNETRDIIVGLQVAISATFDGPARDRLQRALDSLAEEAADLESMPQRRHSREELRRLYVRIGVVRQILDLVDRRLPDAE